MKKHFMFGLLAAVVSIASSAHAQDMTCSTDPECQQGKILASEVGQTMTRLLKIKAEVDSIARRVDRKVSNLPSVVEGETSSRQSKAIMQIAAQINTDQMNISQAISMAQLSESEAELSAASRQAAQSLLEARHYSAFLK